VAKAAFDCLDVHAAQVYLLHKVNGFFVQLSFPYPKRWFLYQTNSGRRLDLLLNFLFQL